MATAALTVSGQAKRPTLMVVPGDAWCAKHHYVQTLDIEGRRETQPDYKAAVAGSQQLNVVISKIGGLMADRGFPLKDLGQSLKSMARLSAEDRLMTSKKKGTSIAENPLDKLRRTAKADMLLEVDWMVNTTGPKHSITYTLTAKDAYSDKTVASAGGTGRPSFSAEVPLLLEEAVQDHMEVFASRLQSYFDDLQANGREVVLDMQVSGGSNVDFTKDYGGYELNELIDNWLHEHCVQHRFNKSDATASMLLYEQVRIPLYKDNGQAQDTYGFARELARHLGAAPYGLSVKTVNRGLGRCLLVFEGGRTQENTATMHTAAAPAENKQRVAVPASDVDIDIPSTGANNDKTFAVIFANENYQEVVNVDFAENDGEMFKEYCHKVLGLPEGNIHLRKNATKNNMIAEVAWMKKVADAYNGQAKLIVFYAGHGIPDEKTGSAYLLPVDGIGTEPETAYSLTRFYQTLGALPVADVTVFMDACFSGSRRGSGMLVSARGVAIKAKAQAPQGRMVVFSAAQGDETAYPLKDKKHGLFTYYLLKKLKETKGNVTYGELATYLQTEVKRKSIVANNKSQTPTVSPSQTIVNSWKDMKLK